MPKYNNEKEYLQGLKSFIIKHFPHLTVLSVNESLNYRIKPDIWCIDAEHKDVFIEFKMPQWKGKKYHYGSKLAKAKAQAKFWFEKNLNLKEVLIFGFQKKCFVCFYLLRKEDLINITYKYP